LDPRQRVLVVGIGIEPTRCIQAGHSRTHQHAQDVDRQPAFGPDARPTATSPPEFNCLKRTSNNNRSAGVCPILGAAFALIQSPWLSAKMTDDGMQFSPLCTGGSRLRSRDHGSGDPRTAGCRPERRACPRPGRSNWLAYPFAATALHHDRTHRFRPVTAIISRLRGRIFLVSCALPQHGGLQKRGDI